MSSKELLLDSLAPIIAIASELAEHEGEVGALRIASAANKIIELTQQVLAELEVTPDELDRALQRYNEQESRSD